ncbi:MAG: hypothetical protein H0Z32_15135 [Bacillaceae bacterium]|nr:hypothetical protein [Bacillaceae bacterium]
MRIVFLVNTPFHLYKSFIISKLLKKTGSDLIIDLINIEDTMNKYQEILNGKKTPWHNIYFLNCQNRLYQTKKIKQLKFILKSNSFAKKYILDKKPHILVSFIDHHFFNAKFIDIYKKQINKGKYILVEEGIAPYIKANYHKKTGFLKQGIKKLIGVGNIKNLSQGRVFSPNVALVSDMRSLSKGYAMGAKLIEMPKGPFPLSITNEFNQLIESDQKILMLNTVRNSFLFLSQPLSEDKLFTFEEEKQFIRELGKIIKTYDLKIFVKLHPRDSKKKEKIYNDAGFFCLKDLSDVPIETLFSIGVPKAVLTYFSSAAVNYNIRNNGFVIWLEEIFCRKKNIRQKQILIKPSERLIKPKNFKELQQCIIKLKKINVNSITINSNDHDWQLTINSMLDYVKK